jgi:hypothetical protein
MEFDLALLLVSLLSALRGNAFWMSLGESTFKLIESLVYGLKQLNWSL